MCDNRWKKPWFLLNSYFREYITKLLNPIETSLTSMIFKISRSFMIKKPIYVILRSWSCVTQGDVTIQDVMWHSEENICDNIELWYEML